jgi:hypothetical protein
MIDIKNVADFYKKIFIYQEDMFITFAMFYMIILGNNIRGIFTCSQINFFENNKHVVFFTSFILFYFLCSLVSNTGSLKYVPPVQKLLYTIVYFFIFIITTRLDFNVTFAVLALIFLIYFIELNKNFYIKNKDTQSNKIKSNDLNNLNDEYNEYNDHWITLDYPFEVKILEIKKGHFDIIDKIENILYIIIYILIILGLLAYGGQIKDTLSSKKEVTWIDVFANTKICHIKDKRPFTHYLKLGLGLKL